MNHKNIRENLLLYIDNGLSKAETVEIKAHIDNCPACKKQLDAVSIIWKAEKTEKRDAPQRVWIKLEAEIKEYEQKPVSFDIFYVRKKFAYVLQPAVMAILVFISVLTGYFGGNFLSKEINGNQANSNNEQVAEAFYLDRLETENISNVLIVASNENGEGY